MATKRRMMLAVAIAAGAVMAVPSAGAEPPDTVVWLDQSETGAAFTRQSIAFGTGRTVTTHDTAGQITQRRMGSGAVTANIPLSVNNGTTRPVTVLALARSGTNRIVLSSEFLGNDNYNVWLSSYNATSEDPVWETRVLRIGDTARFRGQLVVGDRIYVGLEIEGAEEVYDFDVLLAGYSKNGRKSWSKLLASPWEELLRDMAWSRRTGLLAAMSTTATSVECLTPGRSCNSREFRALLVRRTNSELTVKTFFEKDHFTYGQTVDVEPSGTVLFGYVRREDFDVDSARLERVNLATGRSTRVLRWTAGGSTSARVVISDVNVTADKITVVGNMVGTPSVGEPTDATSWNVYVLSATKAGRRANLEVFGSNGLDESHQAVFDQATGDVFIAGVTTGNLESGEGDPTSSTYYPFALRIEAPALAGR